MNRCAAVLALLLTAPALASSPDEAKKREKPKPPPPPAEDKGPGKPRGGDKRAPVVPEEHPELPGGRFYRHPRTR